MPPLRERPEDIRWLTERLLASAIGTADQTVRGGAQAKYFAAVCVEDDGFGALGAAVDAEEQLLCCHV